MSNENSPKLLKIIPNSLHLEESILSYFTTGNIGVGDIIEIKVRGTATTGLVASTEDIGARKLGLKGLNFKLHNIKESAIIYRDSELLRSVQGLAQYYAIRESRILHLVTPRMPFIKAISTAKATLTIRPQHHRDARLLGIERSTLEARLKLFIELLPSMNSDSKGNIKSSVICVPNQLVGVKVKEILINLGISNAIEIYSSMTTKKIKSINAITKPSTGTIIVTTAIGATLLGADVGCVLVEQVLEGAYRTRSEPSIDLRRHLILYFSGRANVILSDALLPLEFTYKKIYKTESKSKVKSSDLAVCLAILEKKPEQIARQYISKELFDLIWQSKNGALILTPRRGLSPLSICYTCGETVKCMKCNVPLVLYKIDGLQMYHCNHCTVQISSEVHCANCQSWNIRTFGLGTSGLARELMELIPSKKFIDTDKLSSRLDVVSKIYSNIESGINVISTLAIVPRLLEGVDNIAIVGIDNLLHIPDYQMNERILSKLVTLRGLSRKNFLVQTRLPELDLFRYVFAFDNDKFRTAELSIRKKLQYPPYSTIVKLTLSGSESELVHKIAFAKRTLTHYNPIESRAFIPSRGGLGIWNIIVKISESKWQDPHLIKTLKLVEKLGRLQVSPETLL